jgi:hypothetical protein
MGRKGWRTCSMGCCNTQMCDATFRLTTHETAVHMGLEGIW